MYTPLTSFAEGRQPVTLVGGASRKGGRRSGRAFRGRCEKRICLCGACACGLVSRSPGRLRDPPWGHYDPCARSSLTARVTSGHASADRSWANTERHSLEPQQSAERRPGGRSRRGSQAILRSAHPRGRPRVRRFRTSACRRSAPLDFFGERKRTRGTRSPTRNRPAERWLFDN